MPTPRSRSESMSRNSTSVSARLMAEVGSSITRILVESNDRALAISTICCWATVRLPTTAFGFRAMPSSRSSSLAWWRSARSLSIGPTRGSRPM